MYCKILQDDMSMFRPLYSLSMHVLQDGTSMSATVMRDHPWEEFGLGILNENFIHTHKATKLSQKSVLI
jgi:hypothetical protein